MNKSNHTPLETVKAFYSAWFTARNLEQALACCAEDAALFGTGENEYVQGRYALKAYLQTDMDQSQSPFSLRFDMENEQLLTSATAIVSTEFDLQNSDYILHLHSSCTLTLEESGWIIRHIQFSMPAASRQQGTEHYPIALVRKSIAEARYELLSSTVAGGLMGGYVEDKFPFYYINDRMLAHLGYASEAAFIKDNDGYISNCMHPDDRQAVDDAVERQLKTSDEYIVEYRMRKQDGSYIYVHDIGRVVTAEDGRPAIISVCMDITEQQFERQQSEDVIKALNAGMLIATLKDGKCIPSYISPGVGRMTGNSQQEMLEIVSHDLTAIIHPLDRERFLIDQQRAVQSERSVDGIYRFLHKNGNYVWIRVIYQPAGKLEGATQLRYIFGALSEHFDSRNIVLNSSDRCIFVIDPSNYELCYVNDAGIRFMASPTSDFYGRKCYELIAGKDKPCDNCCLSEQIDYSDELYIPRLDKTYNVTTISSEWMEKPVRIEYYDDITVRKRAQEELEISEQRLAAAIRHADLQFWEYDIRHERAIISEFTQQTYGLPPVMEDFPESFFARGIVHTDDIPAFRHIHDQLKNGAKEVMLEYRAAAPNQEFRWLMVRYTVSLDSAGTPVRAFATTETIERFKNLEEGFLIAAKLTGVQIWTIDTRERSICFDAPGGVSTKLFHTCQTEDELLALDVIAPEDVHDCWLKLQAIYDGATDITFRARLKCGGNYHWNKIVHTVLHTRNSVQTVSIAVCMDIHEHTLLEQRYKQEMDYSSQLQATNLITKVQCNITTGTVDQYIGTDNTAVTMSGARYDDSVKKLALSAVKPEDQDKIRYYLDRERILKAYAQGESSCEFVYERQGHDRSVFWAHTMAKTYQDPCTGDIMSFMYTFDIDEQKTSEIITSRVVDTNFEYLTLFSTVTGMVERVIDKAGVLIKPTVGAPYEKSAGEGLDRLLPAKDKQASLELFKIDKIVAHLNEEGTYSFSLDIFDDEQNAQRHKLWVYNWYNDEHTKVLCSRSDITDVHRQEQQQRDVLSAALAAAEQANSAKSTFLSRMSHEIRTPMNAIIGMTAIAAKSLGNDERVADCLSKIGISSRFLLSLINDILDMSRIESGKMLLKNEKIPFEEFLSNINAICYPQADAKGITYECVIDSALDPIYLGDAMKLQQVLVNILGNAIKFTDRSGKVTFSISEQRRMKNNAVLRFVISDTGIGMSEEFLPHIYEAFQQEHIDITAGFGGTGLGLAISKNLVDLMDGRIEVHSIKGIGTEFMVNVKLGLTEESLYRRKSQESCQFSHLETLVVDDDVIVCESAVLTLKEIGVEAEWVDSGARAVEKVREMWDMQRFYDIILIDWKMPEMDGIETCRCIRKIVGPDVTIIIMTAYDWYSIESEAKEAGVNLLMNKPMFKSSLVSAFTKVLEKKEEEKPSIARYDFTGKRLLLVEDSMINAEIAVELLKEVGFAVEVAGNGLLAIEQFLKTTPGYYNAILMDIRMPVMDELQASANIRRLSREDAKTIPIIAMTADAFDEDAEKCKAVGMNHHLAKPIDPPMLYRTLYDFIC